MKDRTKARIFNKIKHKATGHGVGTAVAKKKLSEYMKSPKAPIAGSRG